MIGSASVGSVTSHGVTYALKNMITQSVYVIAGAGVMIFIARVFKTRYITYSASMKLYLLGIFLMIICIFLVVLKALMHGLNLVLYLVFSQLSS